MFRDKAFNISILISAVWHLFWISCIYIINTPTVQTSNVYQEVDFLGPILEKTAFDIMVEEISPQRETLYARSALFINDIYLKAKGPERIVLKDPEREDMFDRFTFLLRNYLKDAKASPLGFAENMELIYKKASKTQGLPFMEGPASGREIIFKSEPLGIPAGLYDEAEEYVVRLKFSVSDNGIVYDAKPLVSSGYPEIDLLAIRSLKTWRFSPLSSVEKEKSSWGIVTIRIKTK